MKVAPTHAMGARRSLSLATGVGGDSYGRLVAENASLAGRLQRLGPALAGLAHDLASARRENAALRRENVRLQALIATSGADGRRALRPRDSVPRDQ